ncbi:MAG: shikimate dehydrogenase, partial [Candidatus Heimdallarchaeota archaeon]
ILQFAILEQLMQPNALRIGLIGKKLSHSASPLIHHLFMQESKQPGYYHLLEATNEIRANTLIKRIMEYEFSGLNITFPYKTSVIPILDSLNDDAHSVQAVNTIHMKNGKLLGCNTDISGFTSFMKNHDLHKYNKAMILGAGGASRAVCASLIQLGIEIIVVSRNSKRINEFPEELRSQISFTTPGNIDYKQDVEIYINATPLGLEDNDPREFVQIPSQVKVVIDLLYHRNDTIMVKEVKSSGIEAYDGKEMLFNQAADSYEIWTGSTLDLPSIFKQFIMEFDSE